MTLEERGAIALLQDAREYLNGKSLRGDEGYKYKFLMADWMTNILTAMAIIDSSISRIHLEAK